MGNHREYFAIVINDNTTIHIDLDSRFICEVCFVYEMHRNTTVIISDVQPGFMGAQGVCGTMGSIGPRGMTWDGKPAVNEGEVVETTSFTWKGDTFRVTAHNQNAHNSSI